MSFRDELNNAKKVVREGTTKEKVEYFWDYYKWHMFILIFIVGMIGNILYTYMIQKDYVLQGIFLNAVAEQEDKIELEQNFIEHATIDSDKETVFFDTNYYFSTDTKSSFVANSYETLQIMHAKIATGEIDFIVGDLDSMNNIAYREYFYELPEVISDEILKKYEKCFLYYDRAFIEKLNNMDEIIDTSKTIIYPDPRKPELMEDPVPIFIDVSKSQKLQGFYPYADNVCVMAFAVNSENNEEARCFLDYLMQ